MARTAKSTGGESKNKPLGRPKEEEKEAKKVDQRTTTEHIIKQAKKRGRPLRFRHSMIEEAERLLGDPNNGFNVTKLAKHFGVERGRIYIWAKKYDAFKRALERGRLIETEELVTAQLRGATGYFVKERKKKGRIVGTDESGKEIIVWDEVEEMRKYIPPSTGKGIFMAKNLMPDRFKDRREVEITPASELVTESYKSLIEEIGRKLTEDTGTDES